MTEENSVTGEWKETVFEVKKTDTGIEVACENTVANEEETITLLKAMLEEKQKLLEQKEKQLRTAMSLAYTTGWLAYCWNDHNHLQNPEEYARKAMNKLGLDTFEKANEFLAGLYPGFGLKLELPVSIPKLPADFVALPFMPVKGPAYEHGLWSMRNWEAILEDNPQYVFNDDNKVLTKEQIDEILETNKVIIKGVTDINHNVRRAIDKIIETTILSLHH